MSTFYHVAPNILGTGSIILPGNWGRILSRYRSANDVLYRETVFGSSAVFVNREGVICYAASRVLSGPVHPHPDRTRSRKSSRLARPYIERLRTFNRLTCPST